MEILSLKNMDFRYSSSPILEGIHLSINKGEQASLLGLSGSGKTTLLRICAGFEKPSQGKVFLRGQEVGSADKNVRCKERKIGFVFQDYALFSHMSIKENIEYGCKTTEHKKKAAELIQLLGLSDHLAKKPAQLSGGEKQKVALARTLCLEPDIVFLDEPFASIDRQQTKKLVKELRHLFQKLGVTSLMVTHSQQEAVDFSDRIFVLHQGHLLQSGTAEELYNHPQDSFVADFFGLANWLKGSVKSGKLSTELGSFSSKEKEAKEVRVLVRPESLQISQNKEEGLSCQVIACSYRFGSWLIDVKTPQETLLTVSSDAPCEINSSVGLGLREQRELQVFPI